MKWTFEAIRLVINRKELKRVISQRRAAGYELAVVRKSGNKIGIAFATDSGQDQFDFATELALSKSIDSKHSAYIEVMNNGNGLFVEFDEGLPQRVRIMTKEEVEQEISWLHQEGILPKKLLAFGQFKLPDVDVNWQEQPLTETLTPSSQSFFATSIQALKPQESKKRKLGGSLAALVLVATAVYLAWPNKEPVHIEDITDVNAPYVRAVANESFDFHTRMLQLYAFHRLFDKAESGALAGWSIERVMVGRRATSFSLKPKEDIKAAIKKQLGANVSPTAGGVQRFIDSQDFKALVGTANFNLSTMSIELDAINKPIEFDPYSGKFDVREIYHKFSDLVNRWIPRGSLKFVSDSPANLFIRSELSLEITGAYIEDLIGMGGMMKGFPITFNSTNLNDPVIGQYRIDDTGKMTGEFSLTTIGTKHATH